MPNKKEQPRRQKRRSKVPRGIFHRGTFRGLLAEIAREQGTTRSAIYHGLYRDGNPRIIAIVKARMEQREQDDFASRQTIEEIERMALSGDAE